MTILGIETATPRLSVALLGESSPLFFEERATENEGDEVLEDLGNAALAEIAQIESALSRIGDGTYGECVTCGGDIPEARLKAVPHAAQCMKCAS